MAQYKIHFKDKIYLVQANNPHEAVNTLACALCDERFPLVYYKILKNLGYTHNDWINWSLSTAKRIIENKWVFAISVRFMEGYDRIKEGDYIVKSTQKPSEILRLFINEEEEK